MTRKPRSADEIERIRDRILGEALVIISGGGYDTLTMRDLASRVHMTSTNIYNYFSSKDEIYLMLVIQGFRELKARLETAGGGYKDPVRSARALLEAYYNFGMEMGHYYDIMFTLPMPRYRDYVGTGLQSIAQVEMDLSDELVEKGLKVFAALNPKSTKKVRRRLLLHAWCLLHGIISLARSKVLPYVEEDLDGLLRGVVDELLGRYK